MEFQWDSPEFLAAELHELYWQIQRPHLRVHRQMTVSCGLNWKRSLRRGQKKWTAVMKWPTFSFGRVDWWTCGLIEFLQVVCPRNELVEWLVGWLMEQSHLLTKRLVKQAVHWVAMYLVALHLLQGRCLNFRHSLMDCSSPNVTQLNRRRFGCLRRHPWTPGMFVAVVVFCETFVLNVLAQTCCG